MPVKKNVLIVLDNVQGNISTNTMRQLMAKVSGIRICESDGSGIQFGVAARVLSPNSSWEFNVRQNGYDIAADPYGYPKAFYNPQLQSVQRIEKLLSGREHYDTALSLAEWLTIYYETEAK
jgi:Fe(3+) dicitrate transport protein